MTYANNRREQYRIDVNVANDHYRNTGDLKAFQSLNTAARESWHSDIVTHYRNELVETELLDALSQGGRVYATLDTGEVVRVHNIGSLYSVTDITGAPAEPLIARMASGFTVSHTTVADLIGRA